MSKENTFATASRHHLYKSRTSRCWDVLQQSTVYIRPTSPPPNMAEIVQDDGGSHSTTTGL